MTFPLKIAAILIAATFHDGTGAIKVSADISRGSLVAYSVSPVMPGYDGAYRLAVTTRFGDEPAVVSDILIVDRYRAGASAELTVMASASGKLSLKSRAPLEAYTYPKNAEPKDVVAMIRRGLPSASTVFVELVRG